MAWYKCSTANRPDRRRRPAMSCTSCGPPILWPAARSFPFFFCTPLVYSSDFSVRLPFLRLFRTSSVHPFRSSTILATFWTVGFSQQQGDVHAFFMFSGVSVIHTRFLPCTSKLGEQHAFVVLDLYSRCYAHTADPRCCITWRYLAFKCWSLVASPCLVCYCSLRDSWSS